MYGMVINVDVGKDDKVRHVTIRYRNTNENNFREIKRSVQNLVLIRTVDDCDVMNELGEMAKSVDLS